MNKEGKGGFQDHPELRSVGHPMAGTSYKEILQRISEEPPSDEIDFGKIKSNKELQCRVWFKKSFDDLKTFETILNRIEGKPTERIEGEMSVNLNIKDVTREIREFLESNYPKVHEKLMEYLQKKYDRDS